MVLSRLNLFLRNDIYCLQPSRDVRRESRLIWQGSESAISIGQQGSIVGYRWPAGQFIFRRPVIQAAIDPTKVFRRNQALQRSWAILVPNFFVENEKLTKFREHLSQTR
jgi:hypothetical protein